MEAFTLEAQAEYDALVEEWMAYYQTSEEPTEEEVNEFCLGMPRYQRPRKIIFAAVPRNPTGKIEKPKLRKIYGAEGLVDSQNKS